MQQKSVLNVVRKFSVKIFIGRIKTQMIDYAAGFLRSNLMYVAIGIIATAFAVFGFYLLKALKSMTRKMNFLIRLLIYIYQYRQTWRSGQERIRLSFPATVTIAADFSYRETHPRRDAGGMTMFSYRETHPCRDA